MRFSSPVKRQKPEIKPVKLSYYSHETLQKAGIKSVPRKLRGPVRIILYFLLVGALVPILYYLSNKYQLLKITEVEVFGANNYVPINSVKGYLENKALGSYIFTFGVSPHESNLAKDFLGMENVTIKKKWPNKLVVTVSERTPVAVLVNSDKRYLVDKDGYVMKKIENNEDRLSEIIYSETIKEGEFINQNIVPLSIQLLNFAKDSNLVINKMQFSSQYITLNINDNIEVDLSLTEDNTAAMKQVAAIKEKTSSEGLKLRKVDLRFEKVIVLYD